MVAGTATLTRQTPTLAWCTATPYQAPPGVVGVLCELRLTRGADDMAVTVAPLDAGAPRVTMGVTRHETGRGCVDACTRDVTFTFKAGQRGTWRYQATSVQGGQAYLATLTVVQN